MNETYLIICRAQCSGQLVVGIPKIISTKLGLKGGERLRITISKDDE